ncbi:MAG TPA: guanosine monophosphate reductase [Candidatus Woesebacteria bacterium]|nr:guanosine monophosphate reductase [Candidatus Woesebacteria bacterium]
MTKYPLYLSLDDVLLLPQYSEINSRSEVDLSWKLDGIKLEIPVISSNMDCVTGVKMAISLGKLGGISIIPRFDKPDIQCQKIKEIKAAGVPVAASIGIRDEEWQRLELLLKTKVDHINIDVAHGHLKRVQDFVYQIKQKYPHLNLSAGVVGTADGARDLFNAGVDIVKVGVGPGSICTTRIMTGCGSPQFTAICECSKVARHYRKIIWADGGIKNSGDAVKCLAAGASAVVLGNVLAGTDEAPPEIITINGQKYKSYNGSTSLTEKRKQLEKDGSGKNEKYIKHVEGVEGFVPYKGPLSDVIEKFIAGIKSGYSYCGALNTEKLWKKAKFIQVTASGVRENNFHDIIFLPPPQP